MRGAGLALAAAILLAAPPEAAAFWNLWSPAPALDPVTPPPALSDARDSTCDAGTGPGTAFGETAWTRGAKDAAELPPDFRRRLAGAYLAETPATARMILDKDISSSDPAIRAASRIGLAFALARRIAPLAAAAPDILVLLDDPVLADDADAAYLRAAIALDRRRWGDARKEAAAALTASAGYYNAQVIHSLALLHDIASRPLSRAACATEIERTADALSPLLALGACPAHVAHFDETADRYLPEGNTSDGARRTFIRRAMLAFVARNDALGYRFSQDYAVAFGADDCDHRIKALFADRR